MGIAGTRSNQVVSHAKDIRMDYAALTMCIVLCAGGSIASGYSGVAAQKGWPVGLLFQGSGMMTILGGFVGFSAAILSAFLNPWWTAFIVFVAGVLLARIGIEVLKIYAPMVSGLLLLAGTIWLTVHLLL